MPPAGGLVAAQQIGEGMSSGVRRTVGEVLAPQVHQQVIPPGAGGIGHKREHRPPGPGSAHGAGRQGQVIGRGNACLQARGEGLSEGHGTTGAGAIKLRRAGKTTARGSNFCSRKLSFREFPPR